METMSVREGNFLAISVYKMSVYVPFHYIKLVTARITNFGKLATLRIKK